MEQAVLAWVLTEVALGTAGGHEGAQVLTRRACAWGEREALQRLGLVACARRRRPVRGLAKKKWPKAKGRCWAGWGKVGQPREARNRLGP